MNNQRKLKRVVIKEELVALTGHFFSALALNQFLYWSERTYDFDDFILEEKSRNPNLEIELRHGWIYKTANQLTEELMVGVTHVTMLKYINQLVEKGWLDQRSNPTQKWDRTFQYRPNIHKIQQDLAKLGYTLEGYPLLNIYNGEQENYTQSDKNLPAIPETTIKTTTKRKEGALAPAPPKSAGTVPEPAPEPTPEQEITAISVKHPAIKAFQAEMHRYPRKEQFADIAAAVGEKPEDVEFWQRVVKAWKLLPYAPTNICGMLEYFGKKEIPTTCKSGGQRDGYKNGNSGNGAAITQEAAADLARAQAALKSRTVRL